MKKTYKSFVIILLLFTTGLLNAQTVVGTVTDYDGNIYHTVQIGNQIWLQENMKCLHYSDGTLIPGVAAFDNSEANASIYGRLYTWDAAMKNSRIAKAQGIAPAGYHIPSDEEWLELENYLGGPTVAGGKMKSLDAAHWKSPNTGATNSSGFNMIGAGEYDAYYQPNIFRLFMEYAVLWTSTEISSTKARERYITFDKTVSAIYDWYKVMKYSIRCIKDNNSVGNEKDKNIPKNFGLNQNYPNPFNPSTVISYSIPTKEFIKLKVCDSLGREVAVLVNSTQEAGIYSVNYSFDGLSSGVYIYTLTAGSFSVSKKMMFSK